MFINLLYPSIGLMLQIIYVYTYLHSLLNPTFFKTLSSVIFFDSPSWWYSLSKNFGSVSSAISSTRFASIY